MKMLVHIVAAVGGAVVGVAVVVVGSRIVVA